MKNVIFTFICLFLVSCNEKNANNQSIEKAIPQVMDISSYTGNAIAFFVDGIWGGDPGRFTMQLITVEEPDSNIFKQDTFDIIKHVQGRPSIYFSYGTEIYKLYQNKYKKKYDLDICNIYNKIDAYIKIWISYENYMDVKKETGDTIWTDSCAYRMIDITPNGALKEFKVLTLTDK